MRAQRLFPIVLSVVLSLLVTACKDTPTSPNNNNNNNNDPAALKGTWIVESEDGQSLIGIARVYTVTDNTVTLTDASNGCRSTMTYTVSGNQMTSTLVETECFPGASPGETAVNTWSISNDKLTMTGGGTTTVLRRVAGNDRVLGSWNVTRFNGQPLAAGTGMSFYLYNGIFEIFTFAAGASEPCLTEFDFNNTGSTLQLIVTDDECGTVNVGATDTWAWSVDANGALTFNSSGTTFTAVRQ